jgi:hypothetical protein
MADIEAQAQPGVLLLLSFTRKPNARIAGYANFMHEQGTPVRFVVWKAERWRELDEPELAPGIELIEVHDAELGTMTHEIKRLVLYRLPGGLLHRLRNVADSNALTRPVVPAVQAVQRLHERVAEFALHHVFNNYYKVVRPRVMARAATKAMRDVDLSDVSRIVAGEAYTVTYAWRLAKQYPRASATTQLDRSPLPSLELSQT